MNKYTFWKLYVFCDQCQGLVRRKNRLHCKRGPSTYDFDISGKYYSTTIAAYQGDILMKLDLFSILTRTDSNAIRHSGDLSAAMTGFITNKYLAGYWRDLDESYKSSLWYYDSSINEHKMATLVEANYFGDFRFNFLKFVFPDVVISDYVEYIVPNWEKLPICHHE